MTRIVRVLAMALILSAPAAASAQVLVITAERLIDVVAARGVPQPVVFVVMKTASS